MSMFEVMKLAEDYQSVRLIDNKEFEKRFEIPDERGKRGAFYNQIGKALGRKSEAMQKPVIEVPDPVFGKVNIYHKEVIANFFKDLDNADTSFLSKSLKDCFIGWDCYGGAA